MPYIIPSTTIQFMKNTGLSMSHENTLYFASESAKNSYWSSWMASNGQVGVVNQTYQRANRNYCRIQSAMAVMYNVDYMRFINTQFEDKWFYAFVTAINYINNNTVEVEYVLDPVMTWMGTFSLKQCFIDRQHTLNDGIGNNIAEEGISVGPYVDENIRQSANYGRGSCVIRIVVMNKDEASATNFGGIYCPAEYHDFETASAAANYISGLVEQDLADNIVNVLMVPTAFENPGQISTGTFVQWAKPYTDVDGYVPKNKKLFCYPYKYLMVDNGEGSQYEYKYEYFFTHPSETSSGNYEFGIYGISGNEVQVVCSPLSYNGADAIAGFTKEYDINMSHFPVCAWGIDSYAAYLAQKNAYYRQDVVREGTTGLINIGTGALGGAMKGLTSPTQTILGGAIEGAGTQAVGELNDMATMVANHLIDNTIRPEAGTQMRGSLNTDLTFSQAQKKFFFHEKSITKNYAMMIDDYFTMFGYRVGQIGTPNMNARPHWTYVKTVGCDVGGNVPATDKKLIENVFDNGIRFWHNLNEMGNYSLDNSPA